MSDNNPTDVKLNENPNGTVSFATEVVATIAGLAATEVDGVASMISPSTGFADMFSRKGSRNQNKNNRSLTKGVRIDLEDNRVSVDVTITVDYGSPIPDVAKNIQENVKKAIETMSGLDVKKVDVHVTGISFEREQRANAELDAQQRKMLEKNVEAEAAAEAKEALEASEAKPEEEIAAEKAEEAAEEETPVEEWEFDDEEEVDEEEEDDELEELMDDEDESIDVVSEDEDIDADDEDA